MKAMVLCLLAMGCANGGAPDPTPDPSGDAERVACDASVPADFATVQEAADAAVSGDTICVGPGTFVGTVYVESKDLTLVGRGPGRTVLDGGGAGPVVSILVGQLGLSGMTITGGDAPGYGGGVSIAEGGGTLSDLVISDNDAASSGGGLWITHSDVEAYDVRLLRNHAITGGGVGVSEGTLYGEGLRIAGNLGDFGGGGVVGGRAGITLQDSEVLSNTSGSAGGGLSFGTTGFWLTNVLVAGNRAVGNGGGIDVGGYGSGSVTNSVIRANAAADGGAVSIVGSELDVSITNTVVAANRTGGLAGQVGGVLTLDGAVADLAYDDFWQNSGLNVTSGEPNPIGVDGNLAVDPMFVSTQGAPAKWDLHLRPGSPLIDAGDPALLDPDGTRSDIGLYGGPEADL